MLYKNGRPARYFCCSWGQADFEHLGVKVGDCSAQTFFEVLILVLAVEVWCDAAKPTVILGDNLPALQEAVALRGKGSLEPLSQALAVVVAARSLNLTVAHLPTEANTAADALSRQSEPGNEKPWPFAPDLARLCVDTPMPPSALWEWIA